MEHKTLFYHSGGSISPAMPSMAKLAPPSASYCLPSRYGHGAPPSPKPNFVFLRRRAGLAWSGLASLGGGYGAAVRSIVGAVVLRVVDAPHFVIFPRFPCCALCFPRSSTLLSRCTWPRRTRAEPPCGWGRARESARRQAVLEHERLDERGGSVSSASPMCVDWPSNATRGGPNKLC